jgi:DNA gyrase subunit A
LADGIQPKVLSLSEVLTYFVEHKKQVVIRRTQYDLKKAQERAHILEGLHKCLSKIDEVIKIIKASKNREDAQNNLMKRFKLTEIQANAILEMKLANLAKLERQRIEDELKEKQKMINEFRDLLASPKKIKGLMKKELQEMKDTFGDDRRTKVFVQKIGEIAEEDLIPQEETVITLTHGGYIKRVNPDIYKIQKRGGKGIMGMKTLGEDVIEHFISCQTHDSLLFFTDSGRVFKVPAYEIPEAARVAKGRGILNFLEITPQEKILSVFSIGKEDEELGIKYLVMATKNGIIKRTELNDFKNVRRSGLIAITLKKNDLLHCVCKSTGKDEIILITKQGQSIRFKEEEIRPMSRIAAGNMGIRLKKQDELVGMDIIKPKTENYLLVLTENGYGKRTNLKEYRLQGRGGSGIKTANITSKTGGIKATKILAGKEEDLIVISQKGQVIRTSIDTIAKLGRPTQGVRIMRMDKGDKVASGACM